MRETEAMCDAYRRRSLSYSAIRFVVIMALTMVVFYGHYRGTPLGLFVLGPIYSLLVDEGRAREQRRLERDGFILPAGVSDWDDLRNGRMWAFVIGVSVFAGGLLVQHALQGVARVALLVVMGVGLLVALRVFVDEVRKACSG